MSLSLVFFVLFPKRSNAYTLEQSQGSKSGLTQQQQIRTIAKA